MRTFEFRLTDDLTVPVRANTREEAERIVKSIIKGKKITPNLIELDVPDIAEDGNVVPVHFSIKCKMTNEDYPKRVHILGLENPFIAAAPVLREIKSRLFLISLSIIIGISSGES